MLIIGVQPHGLYSNQFDKLFSTTSLDLSLGKIREKRRMMPETSWGGSRDLGLRLNTNGTFNIRKGWLNNVKYTLSGSYATNTPTRKNCWGMHSLYSMSNTDGRY